MKKECEVIIETDLKPFEHRNGVVGLAFKKSDGEAKTLFGSVKNSTANRAILYGIKNALPYCKSFEAIHLYLTNGYTAGGFNYLASWKEHGWKTASGGELKNADLWQQIENEIEGKEMIIHLNEFNGYFHWLRAECQRRAKK